MDITSLKISNREHIKLITENPVIGNVATHLGDMYCIRALMTLFPEVHCLILYKENNQSSKKKLSIMFSYLISGGHKERIHVASSKFISLPKNPVSIKDAIKSLKMSNRVPNGFYKESVSNSFISAYFKLNGSSELRAFLLNGMTGEESSISEYKNDIENEGGFPPPSKKEKFLLINYRLSGQKQGGVHPSLDTGEEGMKQLLNATKTNFSNITVVPIGEFKPPDWGEYPTLVEYWDWDSMKSNRSKQVGLFKYLKTNYEILGVIGMRSGVIDLFAFLGFKVISIDRKNEKGWERPYKTQTGLGNDFFQIVELEYPRENEKLNGKGDDTKNWKGTIHEIDLQKIISVAKGLFNYQT